MQSKPLSQKLRSVRLLGILQLGLFSKTRHSVVSVFRQLYGANGTLETQGQIISSSATTTLKALTVVLALQLSSARVQPPSILFLVLSEATMRAGWTHHTSKNPGIFHSAVPSRFLLFFSGCALIIVLLKIKGYIFYLSLIRYSFQELVVISFSSLRGFIMNPL